MITNDPSTWPCATGSSDLIWPVCCAIAMAEGANISGAAPDRFNNPGDLSVGDEWGQNVSGYTTLDDGEKLIVFASKEDGWSALYKKIRNIAAGTSHVYPLSFTWSQMGQRYAGNSISWTTNVTNYLGVSPMDTLASYFASGGAAQPATAAQP